MPSSSAKFPPSGRWFPESGYDPADRLFKRPDGSLLSFNASGQVLAVLKARRVCGRLVAED